MSGMKLAKNEWGTMNVLLVPLILASLFFFASLGFGLWAYMERTDYKENSDQKAAAAVKVAEDKLSSKKDNEFIEREKEPLREYKSPSVFGDITFKYPKTWSGYFEESQNTLTLLMSPGLVSGAEKSVYALRLTVESQNYDQTLRLYESAIKNGTLRATPFRLEKVPSVLATRLDGEIADGVNGAAVVLPLRDKSMVISTESKDYINDFNKIILPNYSYSP